MTGIMVYLYFTDDTARNDKATPLPIGRWYVVAAPCIDGILHTLVRILTHTGTVDERACMDKVAIISPLVF